MAGRTDNGSNALFNEVWEGKEASCLYPGYGGGLSCPDRAHDQGWNNRTASAPEEQPHWSPHLHLASYLMLVLFYRASLIAAIQHPFLDSSQACQQVMYTIRDINFAGGPV